MEANRYSLDLYSAGEIPPWLPLLGEWRLRDFSVFPYLYDGRSEEEERLGQLFAQSPGARLLLARTPQGEVGGLCTGQALGTDREALAQRGLRPEEFFYLGELIVRPEMRGQGLGPRLMARMEQVAREQGFRRICFLSVVRSETHPLRPAAYRGPELLWERLGYSRLGLESRFEWRAWNPHGPSSQQTHSMAYWGKDLTPQ